MTMNQSSTTLGLLGATGAIGRSIAAAMTEPFRVIGRDKAKLDAEFGGNPLASSAPCDPSAAKALAEAFAGLDTVVHLIGVPYHRFKLHPKLMKTAVKAARAAGVKRLLLIGTLYPFGKAQAARIAADHPRAPHTFKGRMRKAQEDILMESGFEWSILRLPDFYGPGVASSLIHDIFVAAAEGRKANVIGPVDVPHEFAFVPDVGPVVAKLLATPEAFGHAWNLGGVGTITQREIARMAFGGEPRLMIANKLMLRLAGLFSPMMREMVEMHHLMTDPLIVDDSALTRLIGPIAKTSYADGVAQCMTEAKAARKTG